MEVNFQEIKPVPTSQQLVDVAFSKARKAADQKRSTLKKEGDKINKSKDMELLKLNIIRQSILNEMNTHETNFPSIDDLSEFYKEMIRITMDYDKLKKSLGVFSWTKKTIIELHKKYDGLIKKAQYITSVNKYRSEFYGRVSSVMKQIKKDLEFLTSAREIMRTYPTIKADMQTYAIAGFPNVGKSTLLKKLTGANPKIRNYAFTTQTLLMGYARTRYDKVQLIDTPGTLNRPEKMNYIETQAHFAMKYAADKIIFIFDPTDTYDFDDQKQLLINTNRYGKEILIFLSKTDIADEEKIKFYQEKYPDIIISIDQIKKKMKIETE